MEQKYAVQELIEKAGHIFLLLPKFHPEQNWIEMVWGFSKYLVRGWLSNEKTKTPAKLIEYINKSFEYITAELCRKYQRLSLRYMNAMKHGATGQMAEWVVRKYKRHRGLPPGWEKAVHHHIIDTNIEVDELDEEFYQYILNHPDNTGDNKTLVNTSTRKRPAPQGTQVQVPPKKKPASESPSMEPEPESPSKELVSNRRARMQLDMKKRMKAFKLESYTATYWLKSNDIMNIFRSFNRIWLRDAVQPDQDQAYQKTILVDNGLGADYILKTINDRQGQFNNEHTDFGMSVVNTDNSNENGYHWVIVVFKRVDNLVTIRVYDPLDNANACNQIWSNVAGTKTHKFGYTVNVVCAPLCWQKDGWRCGYYCVYALLAAGLTADEEAKQTAMLGEDGKDQMQKMPDGFEEIIWTVLRTIEKEDEETKWRTFFLNFNIKSEQTRLFAMKNKVDLLAYARSIEAAYPKKMIVVL
jgi:hypothetical protein